MRSLSPHAPSVTLSTALLTPCSNASSCSSTQLLYDLHSLLSISCALLLERCLQGFLWQAM